MNEVWDKRWLQVAQTIATFSKDPSTQVGSIISTPDNRIVSVGYNGFAQGIEETPERWERPEKYEWVIHAELNAIINARGRDVVGCTLYCTSPPCHRCIQHIINAGIRRVVWLRPTDEFRERWQADLNGKVLRESMAESSIEYVEYD